MKILNYIFIGAVGFILGVSELGIKTWQFYIILLLIVAMIFNTEYDANHAEGGKE